MGSEKQEGQRSLIEIILSIGKDLVSLLRDGALLLLAFLLLVFPETINTILINAGFTKGSVAGFEWESRLKTSTQALQEAEARIAALQGEAKMLTSTLAEAKTQLGDSNLKQRISELEHANTMQQESTGLILSSVAQTIKENAVLVDGRRSTHHKSDYIVGLHTVGIPEEELKVVKEKLTAEGYGVDSASYSYQTGLAPSWFATQPTVFYYSPSALPTAQEVAHMLNKFTKQEFAVQRGNGLGVDPSRRDVTLYVHLIKR